MYEMEGEQQAMEIESREVSLQLEVYKHFKKISHFLSVLLFYLKLTKKKKQCRGCCS